MALDLPPLLPAGLRGRTRNQTYTKRDQPVPVRASPVASPRHTRVAFASSSPTSKQPSAINVPPGRHGLLFEMMSTTGGCKDERHDHPPSAHARAHQSLIRSLVLLLLISSVQPCASNGSIILSCMHSIMNANIHAYVRPSIHRSIRSYIETIIQACAGSLGHSTKGKGSERRGLRCTVYLLAHCPQAVAEKRKPLRAI